ncbi:DUF4232 domain-containing protein [Kitasatospora sp. NPDC004745]|uniref:DUF4232 domain-containing protein n=1 Tax=unclassified Kitasatospora TaxID=2633591 RepID=UPI0033D131AF
MTNTGDPAEGPADVTVLFSRLAADGGVLDTETRTATGLAPGATATGRIDLDGRPTSRPGDVATGPLGPIRTTPGAARQVKVSKVRSVPTAEAPRPGGPCPASGLRLYADEGDAAMGLRVMGLHLRNCGDSTVTVNGYPRLQPLDLKHRPIDGVRVLSGGAAIASGTGADNPPQEIALRPGEGARTTLVWRNTAEAGSDPVNATYLRVRAGEGAAPVMLTPELDLGTTGRLGVGAWAREDDRS